MFNIISGLKKKFFEDNLTKFLVIVAVVAILYFYKNNNYESFNNIDRYTSVTNNDIFDNDKFWNIIRQWSKNNYVFIDKKIVPTKLNLSPLQTIIKNLYKNIKENKFYSDLEYSYKIQKILLKLQKQINFK